jgi:uncharacterized cupredoxin-like copper-binding protein
MLFRRTNFLSIFCGMLIGAIALAHAQGAGTQIDWQKAKRVDMLMVEYDFVPEELRFRRDIPYRLHLVNEGTESHDFTAPDFFAAVEFKEIVAPNPGKTSVFLSPGQSADLYFIPRQSGLFELRCADHDWAGMTGTIIVE